SLTCAKSSKPPASTGRRKSAIPTFINCLLIASPSGRGRRASLAAGAPGEGLKSLQILRPSPCPLPAGEGDLAFLSSAPSACPHDPPLRLAGKPCRSSGCWRCSPEDLH